MSDKRQYQREPYTSAMTIPVSIIRFGKLDRDDLNVQGIDVSSGGLGIVSDIPVSPGFVWFWSRVGKYKGGLLMWSKKLNSRYRAGIQFLPVSLRAEDYLKAEAQHPGYPPALQNPWVIASILVDEVRDLENPDAAPQYDGFYTGIPSENSPSRR